MMDQLPISGNEESEYDLSSIGLEDYSIIVSNEGIHICSESFFIDVTQYSQNILAIAKKVDDNKYCFVDEEGTESILINSDQMELIAEILKEALKWDLEPI